MLLIKVWRPEVRIDLNDTCGELSSASTWIEMIYSSRAFKEDQATLSGRMIYKVYKNNFIWTIIEQLHKTI